MSGKVLQLMLLGVLGTAAFAQDKLNFSGDWKLDVLRSRLGAKADIKSATMKVDHKEPSLKIDMDMETGHGKRAYVLDLTTDGTESQQTIEGKSCTATAKWGAWKGERIRVQTTCPEGSGSVVTTREMKLGGKGKILTTVMTVKEGSGQKKYYEFFMK